MSSYSTDPISLFTDYTSALPIVYLQNMIEATNVGNYTEMGLLIFTMLIADGLTFSIKKLSKNAPQKWNFVK